MNAVSEAPSLALATPARSIEELVAQLLYLSPDKKLEIIARLAQSLQGASATAIEAAKPTSLPAFVGAWANDPEAEQMEQTILAIRHPARDYKPE